MCVCCLKWQCRGSFGVGARSSVYAATAIAASCVSCAVIGVVSRRLVSRGGVSGFTVAVDDAAGLWQCANKPVSEAGDDSRSVRERILSAIRAAASAEGGAMRGSSPFQILSAICCGDGPQSLQGAPEDVDVDLDSFAAAKR